MKSVFAIILLMSIAIPMASAFSHKETEAKNYMLSLSGSIALYKANSGELPSNDTGLKALSKIHPRIYSDPWGIPYHYIQHQDLPNGFGIYSTGPDGVSKTLGNDADDLNTWLPRTSPAKTNSLRDSVLLILVASVVGVLCYFLGAVTKQNKQRPNKPLHLTPDPL